MIEVRLTGRRERIVRWWARDHEHKTVEAMVEQIFDSFFYVVEGQYERETADKRGRKPKQQKASE
jgi:hypothetical protein